MRRAADRASFETAAEPFLGPREVRTHGRLLTCAAPAGVEQEFPVALRTEDRALNDADHCPTRLRSDPGGGALADLVMDGGIAHHPAFADVLAAGLELRFDERHKLRLFSGERDRRRQ